MIAETKLVVIAVEVLFCGEQRGWITVDADKLIAWPTWQLMTSWKIR